MKKLSILIITVLLCAGSNVINAQSNNKYVNPFIGTLNMGHTFPGACVPHGSVQLSPDTDTVPHNVNGAYQKDAYKYCAGYQYSDNTIVGFSHTHLSGTGHSDLGDILLMPIAGKNFKEALKNGKMLNPGTKENPDSGYRSSFSHEKEKSLPGYYEVFLDDYGVKARLTATERVGVHEYTYQAGAEQLLILDLIHGIYNYDGKVLWASMRVENDTLITGYRITNGWSRANYTYFAISFSKPIVEYGYRDKEKAKYNGFWYKFNVKSNFPEIGGKKIVSWFNFKNNDDKLVVKVALSGVSTNGAVANLKAETQGKSFNELMAQAEQKWGKELDIIQIGGDVKDNKRKMLYTSLYHTLINPSLYMDVTGEYRGVDGNIHKANDFKNYTVFSLWDTYRALHPLFNLINRERNTDMVKSMLAHYSQSVHKALPIWSHMGNENWCMIGYHGVSVLADALAKQIAIKNKTNNSGGLYGERYNKEILNAMVSSSNIDYYENIYDYKKLGYVPYDKNRSGTSVTLEYSYDDWCIYNTAMLLKDVNTATLYKERAANYKNVFDKSLGFAVGKLSNGKTKPNFNLLSTHGQGFIEGNSWNYSFYVPQDVPGLIKLMGGDKRFIEKLDSLFTMDLSDEFFAGTEDVTRDGLMGNYVHGNEPSHHIAYLYAWSSQPWKTQYRVREIMNKMYRDGIDGLCGNDDCGAMSAWYIFSAMGFYPVCPGSNQYVLGAPYFPYMKVKLSPIEENKEIYLEIKAPNVSDKNVYVQQVKLNGEVIEGQFVNFADIMGGGVLEFEMGPKPSVKKNFAQMAKDVQNSILTLDTHTDTPMRLWNESYSINEDNPSGCIDFPKMKAGGLKIESFAVFTWQGGRDSAFVNNAYKKGMQTFDKIAELPIKYPTVVGIVSSPADMYKLKKEGKLGVLPTVENLALIGTDISKIEKLYNKGARIFGLVHSYHNDISDSSSDKKEKEHNGLSPFGKEVVKEINRIGGVIDVSHASDKTFFDVVSLSTKPVIASHSSVRAIAKHDRNFTDSMLYALKKNGGVIQICILQEYVKTAPYNKEYSEELKKLKDEMALVPKEDVERRNFIRKEMMVLKEMYPSQLAFIKDYVDHIDYVVNKIGVDYVGIGTDFDGGGGIYDCMNASQLTGITEELLRRGYAKKEIEKIWGGNFARVFKECSNL
ncbi:MAG: GH92 family glycosyl hydrolase [Bacteroidales bacterium]